MKNIKKFLFIVLILLASVIGTVHAEEIVNVTLIIRDGDVIFTDTVPLQPAGTIELNSHSLNADSVLSVLNDADKSSDSFEITDLQYYDSYGSFYLKCITDFIGDRCDNWQYLVNDIYPGIGMDQNILSGGENVYVYFGPQNRVVLSSESINTDNSLTVTAQKYNYLDNSWTIRTGVTVGLTQPDPNNPWSPTEVQTGAVDENGEVSFSSIPVGSYNVGIKEDFYFPTETLIVITPPAQVSGGSVGGNGGGLLIQNPIPVTEEVQTEKVKFNSKKAFEFIISQQEENGSFGEDLYTDWVALALASGNHQDQTIKLIKYFGESKTTGNLLTDYERHSMALMALGLNPYSVNGENYIGKIIDSFDGKQFGDINEDNDDIFALIVLQNAGYVKDEDIIKDTIAYILSKQKENGSWDENVDMTGASMEALTFFSQDEGVKNALMRAKEFLKQNQKDTGGWGNVSSTAWAIEGILGLGEKPEDWIKSENIPLDYLALNQDTDGGMKNGDIKSKLWETAYTVTALSGKTWNQIMQKFEKPEELKGQPLGNPLKATPKSSKELKPKIAKTPNLENLSIQNTATVINSLETQNSESVKKGWFARFLDKIFSVF